MTDETNDTTVDADGPVQAQVHEVITKAKSKSQDTDLIHSIAVEVENLTKTKALNAAAKLSEDIDTNYFKLGGILKLIRTQQWWEGYSSFDEFVYEKFGFQIRKALYLIDIYTNLVDKQIPWEKVGHLGWTKLMYLAPVLTLENLDDWVTRANAPTTVAQVVAMIKAGSGENATAETVAATSDQTLMKFKFHNDQAEQVKAALAKAKGELTTEFDNVALAGICTGFLANASGLPTPGTDLVTLFKVEGYNAVLAAFEAAFPLIDLSVDNSKQLAADAEAGQ